MTLAPPLSIIPSRGVVVKPSWSKDVSLRRRRRYPQGNGGFIDRQNDNGIGSLGNQKLFDTQ
jgi:hypothetical protein